MEEKYNTFSALNFPGIPSWTAAYASKALVQRSDLHQQHFVFNVPMVRLERLESFIQKCKAEIQTAQHKFVSSMLC